MSHPAVVDQYESLDPGAAESVRHGCACSVLLNAGGWGFHPEPRVLDPKTWFVDPCCPLHNGAAVLSGGLFDA